MAALKRRPLFLIVIVLFLTLTSNGFTQSPLDRFFDWYLKNAGINPQSPEAKIGKEYGKDWMNPFASQEQIERDLEDMQDIIVGKEQKVKSVLDDKSISDSERKKRLRKLIGEDAKVCPVGNQHFPFDFLFCPYHGARLQISKKNTSFLDNNLLDIVGHYAGSCVWKTPSKRLSHKGWTSGDLEHMHGNKYYFKFKYQAGKSSTIHSRVVMIRKGSRFFWYSANKDMKTKLLPRGEYIKLKEDSYYNRTGYLDIDANGQMSGIY